MAYISSMFEMLQKNSNQTMPYYPKRVKDFKSIVKNEIVKERIN